jgi:integrase/recombinase XerD
MKETNKIAPFLTRFFQEELMAERNLSPNTILSYRDALKLFLLSMQSQGKKSCTNLSLHDITPSRIRHFLNSLEQERGNSIRSRNHRLAALRSFFEYVARTEPRYAEICRQVTSVPIKKASRRPVPRSDIDLDGLVV